MTPAAEAELENDLDISALIHAELGYLHFLSHVLVDAQPQKKFFRSIAEDWQWERERRIAGAIDKLAGKNSSYRGPLSHWNGYHKGSDKTHATARRMCYLLGFSDRPLNLYVCAGDRDQAALITMAMSGVCRDNPWIADRVSVATYGAEGRSGSTLTVIPQDSWSGQGIFPDMVVAEELSHWQHAEGRRFWDFVLSSVNKRPHCVLEVITNAGFVGSWQWQERNRVKMSPFWRFYEAPVGPPLAKWMNLEKIADDSSGMMPGERDRLYANRWVDPGEESGLLTLAQAEACVDPALSERTSREAPNIRYYACVDYGGVNDRTALCVLHVVPATDRVVIDRLDTWQGSHGSPVAINDEPGVPRSVEAWVEETRRAFGPLKALVLDPYQMESLAQKYERKNVKVERFEYRAGKKNMRMAQLLRTMVQNRKLTWSPQAGSLPGAEDDTFAKELSRLVLKPTIYGYRFDHEAGRHDDRAAAVGMALVSAIPQTPPAGMRGPAVVTQEKPEALPSVPVRESTPDLVRKWRISGVR